MTDLVALSGLSIGILLVTLYVAVTTISRHSSRFRTRSRPLTRLEVSLRLTAAATTLLTLTVVASVVIVWPPVEAVILIATTTGAGVAGYFWWRRYGTTS